MPSSYREPTWPDGRAGRVFREVETTVSGQVSDLRRHAYLRTDEPEGGWVRHMTGMFVPSSLIGHIDDGGFAQDNLPDKVNIYFHNSKLDKSSFGYAYDSSFVSRMLHCHFTAHIFSLLWSETMNRPIGRLNIDIITRAYEEISSEPQSTVIRYLSSDLVLPFDEESPPASFAFEIQDDWGGG